MMQFPEDTAHAEILPNPRNLPLSKWARTAIQLLCSLMMLAAGLTTAITSALAAEIKVQAAVDRQEVFVGEAFLLQISVEGSDSPEEPDLTNLADFTMASRGGQKNSSESITIVNGRMERISRLGYVFNIQLTAKRTGNLVINPITIKVGQQTFKTNAIAILSKKPMETAEFKLRLQPDKETAYEGEPIEVRVIWYLGKDVRNFQFSLPLLTDNRFVTIPAKVDVPAGQEEMFLKIAIDGKEIIAQKGRGSLDGREYTTVSFTMTVMAKEPGRYSLPQATVTCEAVMPVKTNRRPGQPDPFQDDFFQDFFRHGGRDAYQTVAIPSNEPLLTVKALPPEGRPAGFSGLIGQYSVASQATPREASVGDPITLTIMVTGPKFLQNVTLPPLKDMPGFAESFKIPDEIAPGTSDGRARVFTQTIRANRADVKEIPPIVLPFFNTQKGIYETARSAPIPIAIKENRVITAADAQGTSATLPVQQGLTDITSGIAANYEDASVLTPQQPQHRKLELTGGWIALLLCPPLIVAIVLGTTETRRRRGRSTPALRAKRALAVFAAALKNGTDRTSAAILDAIRHYLGDKLNLPAGSLTFAEAAESLRTRGVSEESLRELGALFRRVEEDRFGGGRQQLGTDELVRKAEQVIHEIDKTL